jgi:hypothetical protein
LEIIGPELKALPRPKLEEAAILIHSLRVNAPADRPAARERSAGFLTADGWVMLEQLIAVGSGKIDARDR